MLFAEAVGESGLVYSMDIDKKNLDYIKQLSKQKQYSNVQTVFVDDEPDILLPVNCNLFFLRNGYHHISDTEVFFSKLKAQFKPKSCVAIVEHDKSDSWSLQNIGGHYTDHWSTTIKSNG
jgi:arsenite methyltransferase